MTTQNAINTFVSETGGWVAAQLEACTRCGMCAEACHFYQATGNPEFAPVWKVDLLRRAYEERFTVGGKAKVALGISKPISDADLTHWSTLLYEACTMCNKCAMVCPMGIQLGPLLHDVRSALSDAGVVPPELMAAVNKQVTEGSPLGVSDSVWDDRMEWVADEWEIELPIDKPDCDTLVVFSSIEIMKFPENIPAIAKILNKAGEKWTLSRQGREVVNFGFYEGSEKRTKLFMSRLFEAAKALGVKRLLVTECGHAYDALRWTAANMMDVPAGLEVIHIAGLIGDYVREGRIKLKAGAYDNDGTITFHDACKIQRRGGHIRAAQVSTSWLRTRSRVTQQSGGHLLRRRGGASPLERPSATVFGLRSSRCRKWAPRRCHVLFDCGCSLWIRQTLQHDVKIGACRDGRGRAGRLEVIHQRLTSSSPRERGKTPEH
jgi:Fe-S oxidoreductase